MERGEQVVKIAARMYECRDTARVILASNYDARMAVYRDLVRAVMQKHGCSAIHAPLRLAEAMKERGEEIDGNVLLFVTAAAVDVAEMSR